MSAEKVLSVEEMAKKAEELRKEGKTIAYCHGEFDLLHFGHLRHFKQAASQADALFVTLTPDRFINKGPSRPVYNENYRAEFIASLECVAYVGVNQWATAETPLKMIRPDVYCKGNEYLKKKDVTGRITVEKNLIESLGGRLFFTDDVVFSSSTLSKNHFNVFPESAMPWLKAFGAGHRAEEVIALMEEWKKLNVLVVGESFLVEEKMVHKDSAGNKRETEVISYASGAVVTANQLMQFAGRVTYFDPSLDESTSVQSSLDSRIVLNHTPLLEELPLRMVKERVFIQEGNKPSEVESKTTAEPRSIALAVREQEEKLLSSFEVLLSGVDLVVVVDGGYGLITPKLAELIAGKAPVYTLFSGGAKESSVLDFHPLLHFLQEGEHKARTSADIQLSLQKEKGMRVQEGDFLEEVPAFIAGTENHPFADSTVFALASLGVQTKWQRQVLGFVSMAAYAMAFQNRSLRLPLEMMPFSKFLIALLK